MKYLISGIGPGLGGVGRLMNRLKPEYEANGFVVITKRNPISYKINLSNIFFGYLLYEFVRRIYASSCFYLQCAFIRNSEVVFIHPQTAGFGLLFRLARRSNFVSIYVMDNSFFCIRSYNTHPVSNDECLDCIGGGLPHELCYSFPSRMNKELNISYLRRLLHIAPEIQFLAQNKRQAELLRLHFGSGVLIKIIGMDTGELDQIPASLEAIGCPSYDLVFHGAPLVPKGLLYFIQLARHLPSLNFFIPSSIGAVSKAVESEIPPNIVFADITWESGLIDIIAAAKLVVNPSMWSAPIEGALLKSAYINPNVATVATRFGFEGEFKGIVNHLRLSPDPKEASQQVLNFFEAFC
jgi:hypothetical protein